MASTGSFGGVERMKLRYRTARWLGHRWWIRGRGRLILALCPLDGRATEPFEVEFFGRCYAGRLDDLIDRLVYVYGGHELHVLAVLDELMRVARSRGGGPVTYVDVGANAGHHALFVSGRVDRMVLFEPFAGVRAQLEARLLANHSRNFTLWPVALGAETGVARYYPPVGVNRGIGTLVKELAENGDTGGVEVRIERGDSLLATENGPTVVKIDVEGSELAVLEGMRETLHRLRPAVVMELSDYTRERAGALSGVLERLYPEAEAWWVAGRPGRAHYHLEPCDWGRTGDVLILPREWAGDVAKSRGLERGR